MLLSGVRTPLALFTAPRLRAPVPGKPCTNELAIFPAPSAMSSCVASTRFPFAKQMKLITKLFLMVLSTSTTIYMQRYFDYLQNALQIAMSSIKDIIGKTIRLEPKLLTISPNDSSVPVVVSFALKWNGGICGVGNPAGI